jgi:prolipoprotein diacylglyceryltransferase
MIAMADGGMSAAGTVLMGVLGVFITTHESAFQCSSVWAACSSARSKRRTTCSSARR